MYNLKAFWISLKAWTYKYIGGLFMDEKHGKLTVSLGRVAMVLMLIMFIWIWRRSVLGGEIGVELPSGMLEIFYVLAGYVFGSKITTNLRIKWSNGSETTLTQKKKPPTK